LLLLSIKIARQSVVRLQNTVITLIEMASDKFEKQRSSRRLPLVVAVFVGTLLGAFVVAPRLPTTINAKLQSVGQ
jgi:hypothetical protein